MSNRILALKRINKDIKEITKNPIEGIGIVSINDDPMRYVINMRLMTGPYEGYCVQLLLIFSDTYPTKPPKILIYPNQAIDGSYHHHIFPDDMRDENNLHFKKFCFDLLDNDFLKTSDEKTGWNPSYSISSLLLQVQNFISDPDMGDHVPDKPLINELMDSMDNYTKTFNIIDEKGNKIERVHTWKDPYPPMYFKPKTKSKKDSYIKPKEANEDKHLQQIKENLTCFMLKINYIDDPNILLGYPISIKYVKYKSKKRFELYPIPEIITYDGFKAQKCLQANMVEPFYFGLHPLKSANNEYYNNWLPIYINEAHYKKNKELILKSIAEITENEKFEPEQIFEVFPIMLNSMIIGLYKGKRNLSSSFIKCYFQFIILFKKLCQEFPLDYSMYLNNIFNEIKNNNFSVNKHIMPDIGNIFMVLLFNKLENNNNVLKKIYNALFEDFLERQMYWMFHSNESKDKMQQFLLEKIQEKSLFDEYENNKELRMNNYEKFINDLHVKEIYGKIIDIISNDKGYLATVFVGRKSAKKQVEILIKQSFKELFLRCSKEGREQLKDIIIKNLYFLRYFDEFKTNDSDVYNNFQVHELLKKLVNEKRNEFIKYAFESQRGNYLLLISFFAQKKIEEKGFLEQLEKNYGVYLDVDNFIKEMNQKISEIKTYKELFEYIGADFIKEEKYKNKDDVDLIIDAYINAREKKYIVDKPKEKTDEEKKENNKNKISLDNNIQIIPNRQNLNNQPFRNERNRFNIERDLNNHDNHGPRTTERMDRERIREILINRARNRDRVDEWNEGDFSDVWGPVQIERNIDRNRNSERYSSFESSSNIEHSLDNLENEENQRSEEINESNESELSEFNERRRGRKRLRLIKAKDINKSEESEESENSEESKESLLSEFKKRKGRKRLRLIKTKDLIKRKEKERSENKEESEDSKESRHRERSRDKEESEDSEP